MYSHGGYLYVVGGWDNGCSCSRSEHYRLAENGNGWETRAGYPRVIHRHTSVVDEPNDRVFVLGGNDNHHNRAEVYIYTFSSNSWSHHSNMPFSHVEVASTIIKQNNDERWLFIQRRDHVELYYYNLDTNSGWHHASNQIFKHSNNAMMVSLTPYTTFIMGAWSNHKSNSRENFWVYNSERRKFESITRNVKVEHSRGYWTTSPKNWTVFDSCRAERTYVAVGWGNHDYVR